jgi:predicted permease
MMILNSLFPVFALIVIGTLLKQYHLAGDVFLKTSDRLTYYVFFPTMLFWKVGDASAVQSSVGLKYCLAAICAVLVVYILSSIYIKVFAVEDFKAGAFSQSCYRFNTYIGMAVVMNALGEKGVALFGILIGLVIPIINILAVSTLIWFSGKRYSFTERMRVTTKELILNPLIIACIAGMVYSRLSVGFPVFIDNALSLIAMVALPLALLSIGGSLTFKSLKYNFSLSLVASVFKLLLLPVIGYFFLKIFSISGTAFLVCMIFFALSTSPAIYVLSSQLNSDTKYASSAIVLSTCLSFLSLSAVLAVFV